MGKDKAVSRLHIDKKTVLADQEIAVVEGAS